MSEFWIVSAARMERHATLEAAVRVMENLQRHCPDKTFRVYRCKRNIRSAAHFPKLVALLKDILRDGLTRENRDRALVILTTVGNRSGHIAEVEKSDRDFRQRKVASWCAAAFGAAHTANIEQRGARLLEEAVELFQACNGKPEMAHRLVDFIFARPVGALAQEVGGVSLTLLALCHAAGISADAEEARELERVLAKPLAHFTKRNEAKNAAGINVVAA